MVPVAPGQSIDSLRRNGSAANYTIGAVKGMTYAFVPALPGSYQVTFLTDTTPPTVTGVSPAEGATGVATTTAVTATFNEAMDPATINTSTVEVRTPTNTLVPATVSYNATTRTATLTPTNALLPNTTYTATVQGEQADPRVKDLAGNPLATDRTWSFTTGGGLNCPCTVFQTTAVPAVIADSDTSAIELGMKFQASVPGTITGVRFYKGATNTGTHVGRLWTSSGTLLATVTFTNETASGWQQMSFASPVPIEANTTYVVSYHTTVGHYAANNNYFGTAVVNGPLTAPADGAAGGNGVYIYGAGGFPTQTFQATNYWVDVVFEP
jgi:hypothetical protein